MNKCKEETEQQNRKKSWKVSSLNAIKDKEFEDIARTKGIYKEERKNHRYNCGNVFI
jgi:hypothetical protein